MQHEEIELKGHIIDSMILPRVFDTIMDMGGEFDILEFEIGKKKTEKSYAKISVKAGTRKKLGEILAELQNLGASVSTIKEIALIPAGKDGVAPENFYSTTNHRTFIKHNDSWLKVGRQKMDAVIVVNDSEPVCKTLNELKKGDMVVVGHNGIRITPPERPRESMGAFEFMGSSVSTEKPTGTLIKSVANELKKIKKRGGKIAVVLGPAVIHTGGADAVSEMIRKNFIDIFLAGNAVAVHDIEHSIYGTSLGVNIKTGELSEHGHRNHLRVINKIRNSGSIKNAVDSGVLKKGIMYEVIKNNIPFVLAGSIRDDGPLPEVITDSMVAQKKMRDLLQDVDLVLMLSSTLHSIAVGNSLASHVKTICVDINPSVVTKLMDRGTAQALGIVTDVGEFLPELVKELE
ncbi:TIGR00300 family protein [Candidatus Altiarchaeales archaeon WOR_SM1_SCG]|nr:TIGR00300 family protein [Candidatus Altiarchaeales archaeon WOR_SM1_SCG]